MNSRNAPNTKNILLVMSADEAAELTDLLSPTEWDVYSTPHCRSARELLNSGVDPEVIVTSLTLQDGSWWTLRNELVWRDSHAALIVCLRSPDGGVTDVLEAGCAAVLTPPFVREKARVVHDVMQARQRRFDYPVARPMQSERNNQDAAGGLKSNAVGA